MFNFMATCDFIMEKFTSFSGFFTTQGKVNLLYRLKNAVLEMLMLLILLLKSLF